MSIRKLLLSFSFVCAALLPSAAFGQLASQQPVSSVPSRVTQRVDDTQRVTLRGNTPPMLKPEMDRGLVDQNLPMERIRLMLKRSPEQEAALAAFNERQLDPASADYHHWLTPTEFGLAYGPSDADIASVTGWLERHGFQIYNVSKGRLFIQFSGTAAQVQEAFQVEMHNYVVNGQPHIANDRDPQIPQALSPVVTGIASLHNFFPKHQSVMGRYVTRNPETHKITPVDPASTGSGSKSGKLHPNYVFTDPSGDTEEDIAPYDFATIYNLLPLWKAGYTGKGLSIAISSQTDIHAADITTFRNSLGLGSFSGTVSMVTNGPDPGFIADDLGENTLDTEWSGATAPDAQIIVVASKGTSTSDGGTLSDEYIIDNDIAPIMSASYGECEAGLGSTGNSSTNSLYQQGATEGMSLFESSGDQGSTGCDNSDATTYPSPAQYGLQVNGLASPPYITAVGGTDFAWQTSPTSTYWNSSNSTTTKSNAIGYIPEIPWNGTCTSTFLLQNLFTGESSSEQLCNDAAPSSTGFDNLVKVTGGSGGRSSCLSNTGTFGSCTGAYAKPSWQTGTGVPADGVRDLPDVSLFASSGYPDGITGSAYLICVSSASPDNACDYSGTDIVYQEVGGTSVSSPAMAGIAALILQKVGGTSLGLMNPEFYKLAATENLSNCNASTVTNGNNCLFYDVTSGNNSSVCTSGSIDCVVNTTGDDYGIVQDTSSTLGYTSTVGYDLVTGLGSLNVANLANAWPTTAPGTLSFTPTSLTFPSTTVGSTSSALSVTVKNTSSTAVTFTNIALTGSTDFLDLTTTCPSPLAAGASCTVSAEFKPAAAGTATGAISLSDSATGSPQTVALSGTGATAGGGTGLTITPSSLTFASTTVGTSAATQVITLKNNTSAAVNFTAAATITGTNASSFSKTASTCSSPLAVGASCTNTIEFTPASVGTLTATVTYMDSASSTAQTVALSGTGASASTGLTITPSSLTFASTTVGTSAATQVITLKNNTSAGVNFTAGTTITGSGASSFTKTASTCASPLAAGASCTNTIQFTPASVGTLTATVTYTDSASSTPQTVSLSGTGASASSGLTITPSSLTFASTTVGTSAATQAITIKNNTSASVTFTASTTITGTNASSFTKSASTCTNPLAAGASCTNTITFTPQSTGTLSATVTYTDSASSTPQTVSLYGTGASASAGLTITPSSLTFASTTVGTSAATQLITIKNNTSAAVTFTASTTITGTNASSFTKSASTCTNPLAAGASCTNTITFTPASVGTLTATVTYTDSASSTPQTVALTGTGASASSGLTITPSSLTFASTAVGTSAATQMITLKNNTSAGVSFTASTTITGANASSFSKTASTCASPLAAGASCTNTITFTPQSTGTLSATVTYTDSASSTPQTVSLFGTGH